MFPVQRILQSLYDLFRSSFLAFRRKEMYQLGGTGHIRIKIKIQPDAFLSCPPEQFQHLCAPSAPVLLPDTFHMADMERNVQIPGNPDHFFRSEEHTSELQSRSDLVCRL